MSNYLKTKFQKILRLFLYIFIVFIATFSINLAAYPSVDVQAIQRLNPSGLFDTTPYGFSQVVTVPSTGKIVFVSGQFSGDLEGNVLGNTLEEQMHLSFQNLRTAIEAAGAKSEHVVQIRVLIVDYQEEDLILFQREIQELFGDALPVSTLIPVPRLALDDMLFEIEATLFIPEQ
ncbi:MAG: RidA family protein [Okeania sp. SIO2G4]|uniref:RidA family protein n=1 Tax=unclassified Okeania TaxID=2634635 RepID=UPI0013BB0D97|nr:MULTISPECIES: RidA family protein [unclassified Okeania]NEP03428.1 RidA family protein [Okeania sp. SIO4D6]NEP37805.1 RidA family protein [Okeania sp. SIO2H7]NEP71292.1 RidA family protein [Okeania sp. SIO2G5]NEP92014.1 RidA family protein [Okeania sp. SIO2F5]NEQ89491.1 RidA family protein [Okeania sp. SIO2G4]